jgi:hypothetical protein
MNRTTRIADHTILLRPATVLPPSNISMKLIGSILAIPLPFFYTPTNEGTWFCTSRPNTIPLMFSDIACIYRSVKVFSLLAELNREKIMSNPVDQPFRHLPIDFNAQSGTPLRALLGSKAYELIPIGIRADMNVETRLEDGSPVLFLAVQCKRLALVQVLCRFGVKVNTMTENNWTAFHMAAQARQPEICRILFEHGAHPHLFTSFGMSHCAKEMTQKTIEISQPRFPVTRKTRVHWKRAVQVHKKEHSKRRDDVH